MQSGEFDSDDADSLPSGQDAFIGSTGIYIFKHSVLSDVLQRHPGATDFGRQVLPMLVAEGFKVCMFLMHIYYSQWLYVAACRSCC